MLRAEFIKLKRSSVWVIATILPLLAVATGSINVANNREQLDEGWASLTSQVTLFYALLFFSIGVALLTSSAWRAEHRGTNWNLLLTSTRRPLALVLAKIAAIMLPVAFMQLVLVAGTLIAGTFVLRMPGAIPWDFAIAGGVTVLVGVALIAVQSLLSMLLRSFAAPVAICLLGCVAGMATVMSEALRPLGYLIPQALCTRALTLGSNAITTVAGSISLTTTAPLLIAAALGAAVFVTASLWTIRTIKLR